MDRTQKLMLGVALVPAVCSTVAWFSATPPAVVASAAPRAALGFRYYAINKGDVPPAPYVYTPFEFVNQSDRTVQVTSVTPSCGCLKTEFVEKQTTYQPGEYGMLQVSLPTANEDPGLHEYTIRVAYDDGQPREETLRLTMNLPQPTVRVEPSEIYFYMLNGDAQARPVEVVDPRPEPLSITEAKLVIGREPCPKEIATVAIQEPKTEDGLTRIPVLISVAGEMPPERIIAHLVLSTSDPDYKTLKVPVLLQGPKRAVLPASAEMPATGDTN